MKGPNGIARRSTADREMERQIAEIIGKGPTRRYGPVCQVPPTQKRLEKLQIQHLDSYVRIKAKYEEWHMARRQTPSLPVPEDLILRTALVHRFDEGRALEMLRRMEASFFHKTAKHLERDLKLRVCVPLPFLKTKTCQDVIYFMPSQFPTKEMSSSVIVAIMSYIMNATYERHRDRRRKMCLLVNLDQWTYAQHFRLDLWLHLLDLFQGRNAPMKFSELLFVNVSDDFLKAWTVVKTMCEDVFLERVHFLPNEEALGEYMTSRDYVRHLPDDFATGKTKVDSLVRDFLAFRQTLERLRKLNQSIVQSKFLPSSPKTPTKGFDSPRSPSKNKQALFKSSILTLPNTPGRATGDKLLTSQSEHGRGHFLDSPTPNRRSLLKRNTSDPTMEARECPEPIIELESDTEDDESVIERYVQDIVLTAVQFRPAAIAAQEAESMSCHSLSEQNEEVAEDRDSKNRNESVIQRETSTGKSKRPQIMNRTASMPRLLGSLGLRRGKSSRKDLCKTTDDKIEQPLNAKIEKCKSIKTRQGLIANAGRKIFRSGRNLLSRTGSVATMEVRPDQRITNV
jgi:hypothetical protein